MQFGKLFLVLATLSLFYVAHSNGKDSHHNKQWLELCPSHQFCFQYPKSLVASDILSIDSLVGQLSDSNITLSYDYGLYSSKFGELTKATVKPIEINGYHGKILIEKNKMALVIPKVQGRVRFSMLIEFKNNVDEKQGRKIFNSITFGINK